MLGSEKRFNCPIPAIALMPNGTAVLKLHERTKQARTLAAGSEILSAYVRQIKNWYNIRSWRYIRESSIDHAFEPYHGPLPRTGVVGAEDV